MTYRSKEITDILLIRSGRKVGDPECGLSPDRDFDRVFPETFGFSRLCELGVFLGVKLDDSLLRLFLGIRYEPDAVDGSTLSHHEQDP